MNSKRTNSVDIVGKFLHPSVATGPELTTRGTVRGVEYHFAARPEEGDVCLNVVGWLGFYELKDVQLDTDDLWRLSCGLYNEEKCEIEL